MNNDVVSSDLDYLNGELSTIKSEISALLSEMEADSQSFDSTTQVPTIEPDLINNIYDCYKNLLNKLDIELDAIMAVGESIRDLDIKLEKDAFKLSYEALPIEYHYTDTISEFDELKNSPIIDKDTNKILNAYDYLVTIGKITPDDSNEYK